MTDGVDQGAAPSEGGNGGEARVYGGQFNSVEELEAAYAALQKPADDGTTTDDGLTAKKSDDAPADDSQGTDDGEASTDAAVADALKAAGLDQAEFTKEFAETGALSEESYAKLEKAGYSRDVAEVYVDGLKARRAAYEATILEPAGGKAGYTKLLEWAGKNLSESDIDAFNEAVTSGNAARAKLAVSGLAAQAGKSSSGRPQLLNGSATASGGAKPYASRVEASAAVRDPRYRTDPGFRKAHEARLRVTDFA